MWTQEPPPPNCIYWACSPFLMHLGACVLVVTSFQRNQSSSLSLLAQHSLPPHLTDGLGLPQSLPRDSEPSLPWPLLLCYFCKSQSFLHQGDHIASRLYVRCSSNVCRLWFFCCPCRLDSPLGVPWRKSHSPRKCRTFIAFYEGKNLLIQTLHFREKMRAAREEVVVMEWVY